ncbi:MAG TPA: hypothetical protein VJ775_01445 [Sphingomicrobium sp.]|nr:hypothetical protein [Sphingomicrobium sp.]
MDGIVIELATSLNRHRSLSDQESQWLEQALRRQNRRAWHNRGTRGNNPTRIAWEPKHDVSLKRLLRRGRKPREIARAMGRTEGAILTRIRDLRRAGRLEQAPMARKCIVRDDGE